MDLSLHVVNHQIRPFERDVALVVTERGVSIGRSPANDLPLDDPERVVSGRHARIDLRDGSLWLTDTSRNGTYLNHATDPIPSQEAVALYDGDRLTIGPYEILIHTRAPASAAPSRPTDPFADAGGAALPGLEKVGATTDILDLLAPIDGRRSVADVIPAQSVPNHLSDDPFADALPLDEALSGPAGESPPNEAQLRHTPVEHVFYRPRERQAVPDDYDLLNDSWPNPAEDVSADLPPVGFMTIPPAEVASSAAQEQATPSRTSAAKALPESAAPPRRPDPPRPRPAPPPERLNPELEAFLAGLGVGKLSDVQQPALLLGQAGELLRALTVGLIQTMMGRAQFKSELHLGVTTIRATENNPFKFSAGTDDLLDRLLFRPSPGFLPAAIAAREAFDDIQAHEMAMTAGLRAALRALLARFEPAELERRLSHRSGLDQVLTMSRKAKSWDLFTETYDQVAADAAEDFMRLFGDAFARAYQEQIQHLRAARDGRAG
jgi:type VI secretion system protein